MKKAKIGLTAICLLLVFAMIFSFAGCAVEVQAADLMKGISSQKVSGKAADDRFIGSQAELAVKLFKACVDESKNDNVLISPLSIQLALAMTANGADGQTKEEMEKLLGGDIPLEELNEYLYTYINSLPSTEKYKLELANSVWFRDDADRLTVEKDFLQTNADYYGAQAYKEPFDQQTVKDINSWVNEHTDGMIEKIIDEITPDEVLHLINAIAFDAQWETPYEKHSVNDGIFNALSGDERKVKMMYSNEHKYIDDGDATGFIKDYRDGKYAFAALLPNEGVDLYNYIASLTGEGLKKALDNAEAEPVDVLIPKFSYDYSLLMNDVLAELGMPTAFDVGNADFYKMATSSVGNIFIDCVLHKTFISVDEKGTKAAAITDITMTDKAALPLEREVILDRPFVYMIIDNSTNLPIFIGTVTDIQE